MHSRSLSASLGPPSVWLATTRYRRTEITPSNGSHRAYRKLLVLRPLSDPPRNYSRDASVKRRALPFWWSLPRRHCERSPTEIGFLERVPHPGDECSPGRTSQACSTVGSPRPPAARPRRSTPPTLGRPVADEEVPRPAHLAHPLVDIPM